jgi:uncharacterized protein YdeI (YjbR/CyaY-like superfamily)
VSDHERVEPANLAEWRRWLSRHHGQAESVWLVYARKGNPHGVGLVEACVEALCFGWIDSLPRKLDETRSMIRMSPRKAGSAWSALNKKRVAQAFAEGKMAPPGLAKIEAAKKDGSWAKLDAVDKLTIPPDLAAALKSHAGAVAAFDAFPPSAKRGILEWIGAAKTQATRAARIADTAAKAAKGERANQWRGGAQTQRRTRAR